MSPTHPGTPPASHIARNWQALPVSPIYPEETSGLPHSIPFLKHPCWPVPRTVTILVTAHALPHLILLMPVRSGLLTKEEPGAQRGEVIHARSHSKEVAGPGFKPSSAACKAYRVPEVPSCPSSLLPTASGCPSSQNFHPLCKVSPPPFLVRINNYHLIAAINTLFTCTRQ